MTTSGLLASTFRWKKSGLVRYQRSNVGKLWFCNVQIPKWQGRDFINQPPKCRQMIERGIATHRKIIFDIKAKQHAFSRCIYSDFTAQHILDGGWFATAIEASRLKARAVGFSQWIFPAHKLPQI